MKITEKIGLINKRNRSSNSNNRKHQNSNNSFSFRVLQAIIKIKSSKILMELSISSMEAKVAYKTPKRMM